MPSTRPSVTLPGAVSPRVTWPEARLSEPPTPLSPPTRSVPLDCVDCVASISIDLLALSVAPAAMLTVPLSALAVPRSSRTWSPALRRRSAPEASAWMTAGDWPTVVPGALVALITLPARTSMLPPAVRVSSLRLTALRSLLATTIWLSVALLVILRPLSVWVRLPPSSTLPLRLESWPPSSCRKSAHASSSLTLSTTAMRLALMSMSATRPRAWEGELPAATSKLPRSVTSVAFSISRRPASHGEGAAALRSRSAASTKNCAPVRL